MSRFAPENLLFRDAVCEYQKILDAGERDEALRKMKSIVNIFLDPNSAFEVPNPGKPIVASEETLTRNIFNNVIDDVDRDLGRGLHTLWSTGIFLHHYLLDPFDVDPCLC